MKRLILLSILVTFLSGCAVSLPFNNRLSYAGIKEMKTVEEKVKEKPIISINWEPNTFLKRIDIQGADGFVGGGSRTRIPTGIALSARIEEAISTFANVTSTGKPLVITIIEARSGFEYSAGIFNVTPAMDVGSMVLKASFNIEGATWSGEYRSIKKEPKIGGTSQTALLEEVWDDVAVQVAKDVAAHITQ